MKAPGKKVVVLGLGVTGYESALFLKEKGYELLVSDAGQSDLIRCRTEQLQKRGIKVETGCHSVDRILQADWVLISPGIRPESSIYQAIRKHKIPILSEIEVASWYCPSPNVIAVTGTAGKTTVATLLGRILKRMGARATVCGNIGNSWVGEISHIKKEDFVVLEVSSFQLEHCESFRPKIGVLLNLSPNHEDWHEDMTHYVRSKLKLFQNQGPENFAVFRASDRSCFFSDLQFSAREVTFGGAGSGNPNESAVRTVIRLAGGRAEDVDKVLEEFEGIEHRLEKFLVHDGVAYVNDSKCTTPSSLAWALEKFPDLTVVLIAGGHPKSRDFEWVRDLLKRKVKQMILVGEARPILRKAWNGVSPVFETDDFEEALGKARSFAKGGDAVLLSPACASFDMFQNYEERGRRFKQIVQSMTETDKVCHRNV